MNTRAKNAWSALVNKRALLPRAAAVRIAGNPARTAGGRGIDTRKTGGTPQRAPRIHVGGIHIEFSGF
jgi:hypothetical protein